MKSKAKAITLVGILAAMSSVLYIFPTFPIFPVFPWLEIDFADAPALLASVTVSPLAGGAIVLIRNTVHVMFGSSTGTVGELSNFMISFMFVVSAGFITFLKSKNRLPSVRQVVFALPLAAAVQVTVATVVNKYIMIPLYGISFEQGPGYYIFYGVIPFNLIKVSINCIIFVLIYRFVVPRIKKYL